jgi:purine-binding chemotaxis protein CheW
MKGPPGPEEAAPPLGLVVFALEATRYAVPLSAVERVLPMVAVQLVPGAPRVVLGAINLEGRVVPVVDLRRRLDLPSRDYGLNAHLLIVQTSRRTLAVPADEATGVVEVDPRSVTSTETVLPRLGRVAGIAALGDGLLFIHDIEAFLTPEEDGELGQALGHAER